VVKAKVIPAVKTNPCHVAPGANQRERNGLAPDRSRWMAGGKDGANMLVVGRAVSKDVGSDEFPRAAGLGIDRAGPGDD